MLDVEVNKRSIISPDTYIISKGLGTDSSRKERTMSLPQEVFSRKVLSVLCSLSIVITVASGCGSSQETSSESGSSTERWSSIERGQAGTSGDGEAEEAPPWQLTESTEFNGRLFVVNGSDQNIERVWFSPSDLDNFDVGYEWPETQLVEAGKTAAGPAVEGWWDIWLEAADGNDATIMRVFIRPNAVTRLNVENVWWETGDLMGSDLNLSLRR